MTGMYFIILWPWVPVSLIWAQGSHVWSHALAFHDVVTHGMGVCNVMSYSFAYSNFFLTLVLLKLYLLDLVVYPCFASFQVRARKKLKVGPTMLSPSWVGMYPEPS